MKTITKQIAGAIMMIAAILIINSSQAWSQCTSSGKCGGNCPTLFRHGASAPINVPPYSPDGTGKCHKVKEPGSTISRCACEYRVSGTETTCHLNQTQSGCDGNCPALYATAADAQSETNPIAFGHMDCHTLTTNNVSYCVCIYY